MRRALGLALFLMAATALADPATLRQANQLISGGKPAEAIALLRTQAQAEADNAEYHYLVGIALLDSGQTLDAIAAFKHSLNLNPKLLQSRAELGRAYVVNGDTINAYLAFKEVREANPLPEALAGMERYIDQAANQINQAKKVFGAITLTVGRDTNVNSGTTATEVALPIFGGIRAALSPGANPVRAEFAALGGYVNARQDITENVDLIASGSLSGRYLNNRDLSAFDTEYASFGLGPQYTAGANQLRALGIYEQLNYGGKQLRNESGVAIDWRRLTGGPTELDFNYRRTNLDYNDANTARDARRQVFGVALLPSFFGRRLQYAPPLANIYFGSERPRNAGVDFLGYSLGGVRAGYYTRVFGSTSLALSGGYEERRYGGPDPTFLDTRRDRQSDVSLALIHELTPTLSLIPGVQWIDSASNIVVYANRRTIYSVTLRQAF